MNTTLFFSNLGNHDLVINTNRLTRFQEFYSQAKYNLLIKDKNAQKTFMKGKIDEKILTK